MLIVKRTHSGDKFNRITSPFPNVKMFLNYHDLVDDYDDKLHTMTITVYGADSPREAFAAADWYAETQGKSLRDVDYYIFNGNHILPRREPGYYDSTPWGEAEDGWSTTGWRCRD